MPAFDGQYRVPCRPVTYFQAVRLYSLLEALLFASLLTVWLGHVDEQAKTALGWSHGTGWIVLCLLVGFGCVRATFPWPLLAATVSPLGPIAASIGIEVIRWRDRRQGGGPPAQTADRRAQLDPAAGE